MTTDAITIAYANPDAQAAADALQTALADVFTDARIDVSALDSRDDTLKRKGVDPVAVAALILALPSAVLAVMDIADRIAKRRQAQASIDAAGQIKIEKRVETYVITADGPQALAAMTPDQLLALAGNSDPSTAS